MGSLRGEAPHKPQGGFGGGEAPPKNFRGCVGGGAPHNKGMQIYKFIKKGGIGLHMGRYGLILCANESYTNNLAIGINFDLIWAYKNKKILKKHKKQKNLKHIKNPKHLKIYIKLYINSRSTA